MSRKETRGRKKKGSYVFTREDCRKGYRAALAKCTEAGWSRLAWFIYRVRGYYRERQQENDHGQKEG